MPIQIGNQQPQYVPIPVPSNDGAPAARSGGTNPYRDGFSPSRAAKAVLSERQKKIGILKYKILEIAKKNTDLSGCGCEAQDVVKQLQPLVDELKSYYPYRTVQQELPQLARTWKQVFASDCEPEPPGFKTNRQQTYQTIFKDGQFMNLAELIGPLGVKVTGLLQGKYETVGNEIRLEFEKVTARPGGFRKKEPLATLADKSRKDDLIQFDVSFGRVAPEGPVGAKGRIKNVYLDEDIRIAVGSNDADGVQDLYVLTPANLPEK